MLEPLAAWFWLTTGADSDSQSDPESLGIPRQGRFMYILRVSSNSTQRRLGEARKSFVKVVMLCRMASSNFSAQI